MNCNRYANNSVRFVRFLVFVILVTYCISLNAFAEDYVARPGSSLRLGVGFNTDDPQGFLGPVYDQNWGIEKWDIGEGVYSAKLIRSIDELQQMWESEAGYAARASYFGLSFRSVAERNEEKKYKMSNESLKILITAKQRLGNEFLPAKKLKDNKPSYDFKANYYVDTIHYYTSVDVILTLHAKTTIAESRLQQAIGAELHGSGIVTSASADINAKLRRTLFEMKDSIDIEVTIIPHGRIREALGKWKPSEVLGIGSTQDLDSLFTTLMGLAAWTAQQKDQGKKLSDIGTPYSFTVKPVPAVKIDSGTQIARIKEGKARDYLHYYEKAYQKFRASERLIEAYDHYHWPEDVEKKRNEIMDRQRMLDKYMKWIDKLMLRCNESNDGQACNRVTWPEWNENWTSYSIPDDPKIDREPHSLLGWFIAAEMFGDYDQDTRNTIHAIRTYIGLPRIERINKSVVDKIENEQEMLSLTAVSGDTRFLDLRPIAAMKNLKTLAVKGYFVKNLCALSAIKSLRRIVLPIHEVSQLSELKKLSSLKEVILLVGNYRQSPLYYVEWFNKIELKSFDFAAIVPNASLIEITLMQLPNRKEFYSSFLIPDMVFPTVGEVEVSSRGKIYTGPNYANPTDRLSFLIAGQEKTSGVRPWEAPSERERNQIWPAYGGMFVFNLGGIKELRGGEVTAVANEWREITIKMLWRQR